MGINKYNYRARQVVNAIVDDSVTKQIKVDLDIKGHYDESNELALPSKKRKTKINDERLKVNRILSNKQRKRLKKIVDRKKKKENRADLLKSLQKMKASDEELSQLTFIACVQTKGVKRHLEEEATNADKFKNKIQEYVEPQQIKLNSIKGSKRRKYVLAPEKKDKNIDPNIVGFDSDSEDSSSNKSDNGGDETNHNNTIDSKVENNDECEGESSVTYMESNENESLYTKTLKECKSEIIEIKDSEENKVQHPIRRKPAVYVDVIRNEEIQAARLKLPILAEEQEIMEVINENNIIIISGETGSGKTTQVPQFLYEAGYALKKQIGITEPRRVAAISMSKRVAEEMNLSSKEVSYLIRFEGNVTEETKIKFMTDGVLLKEMQSDFILSKYSVIILDEAHERSIHTDVLIAFLSRIVPLRLKRGDPLKLIIMSATLRLADFTENSRLFKVVPPVINVEGRQFPVTVHFNDSSNKDYIRKALMTCIEIHTEMPEGGILIFVTGQQEVNYLVKKLRKYFPLKLKNKMLEKEKNIKDNKNYNVNEDEEGNKEFDELTKKNHSRGKKKVKIIPEVDLDDYSLPNDTETLSGEEEEESTSDNDYNDDYIEYIRAYHNGQPLWTLPLYSLLPSHKQQKVFRPPPKGCRLCIVSTNVAETSLTIPNIKYVIDTGKSKIKLYDEVTGVTSHRVNWTSKASANQRAGRAGRTAPGHCYRLYANSYFKSFQDFSVPEILKKPVDDLYLQLKCMGVDKINNFPFPTAPDLLQLKTAEQRLEILGALNKGQVTELGKVIAKFPVLPRYGKMLALSHQYNLLPYTILLVAALSVQEVLLETPIGIISKKSEATGRKWAALRLKWAGQGNSQLLGDNSVLLKAVGAAEWTHAQGKLQEFWNRNGLRYKAVIDIRKLRRQLTSEIKKNFPEIDIVVDPELQPPTDLQFKLLRQILLAGMGDQVAKKVLHEETKNSAGKKIFKYFYKANNMKRLVLLHETSVLKEKLPEFVVYQEIYKKRDKFYMRGVTAIEPEWLPMYVPALCNLSEPLVDPPPHYNDETGKVHCLVNGTFGPQAWPLSAIEMPYPDSVDNFKWFARFLLEGKVFKKLEKYAKHLLSQPSVMVNSWARLQPRTVALVKRLLKKRISDKTQLENTWKEEPKYLLKEYLKWLPESAHSEVTLMWPPL